MDSITNKWDIERLKSYIDKSESFTLEFKRSKILEKDPSSVREELTKTISAFTNSEGGILIIGIEEDRKTRLASGLDEGIDFKTNNPEKIQQIIENNIHPSISGLRYFTIPKDEKHERYYLVVCVPKGENAFQARDFKYYGRKEYESIPLFDNEIRLRMLRGKIPQARLLLLYKSICFIHMSEGGVTFPDSRSWSFDVVLENTGEICISTFKYRVWIKENNNQVVYSDSNLFIDGRTDCRDVSLQNINAKTFDLIIFPEDFFPIIRHNFSYKSHDGFLKADPKRIWELYLPDRPKINGEISFVSEFIDIKPLA